MYNRNGRSIWMNMMTMALNWNGIEFLRLGTVYLLNNKSNIFARCLLFILHSFALGKSREISNNGAKYSQYGQVLDCLFGTSHFDKKHQNSSKFGRFTPGGHYMVKNHMKFAAFSSWSKEHMSFIGF